MRRKTKLLKSAFPALTLILIGLVTFTGQLHVAMANIVPGTPLWSDCIKLAHQQAVSPQKPEPLPLDDCYQGLLNKFSTQFLYDITTNPPLIFTYLQQTMQANQKPSLAQVMAQLRFKLNVYQLERQELITVDRITVNQGKVNPNVVKGYNAAIDKPLFDQFVKQQLPIISNQAVDQLFTNAILTSQAIKVQTLCKLTIQINDHSLDTVLHGLQIAFKTVCPQLVKRFASQPGIANNEILTVSHLGGNIGGFSGGNYITFNDDFVHQSPNQVVGALIHELTHTVQAYPSDASVWFREGMADYVRSIYGPADDDWSLPPGVQPGNSYKDGYATTARFLHWLDQHTTPTIVDQLNHAVQTGGSFSATFQRLTGGTVDDEWSKYVADPTLAPFKRIPAPDK